MEETRRLVCAAPAKGTAQYLEEALCADIDQCAEPIALKAVVDLMSFLNGQDLDTGKARVKRELGGHDLPAPHKKSCRTALNRASKALGALEVAQRKEQAAARPAPAVHMERDVRLDDAEEAASREAARTAAMDALFSKASVG